MHTLAIKQENSSKYVTIFFHKEDDLKKAYNNSTDIVFLGQKLPARLAASIQLTNPAKSIWNLKLFKAANTMSESFLKSYEFIHDYLNHNKSLENSGNDTFYSLFDFLKLQDYQKMLDFRAEHSLI